MAPPTGVRARVRPRPLREEAMEGFRDAFDHSHELVVRRGRDRALCQEVDDGCHGVMETEWKHPRGTPCGVFWREGEAARVLPGRLGSKGDAGPALKPPIVEADGGERLDGGMGQRQLSSYRDDEVQVTQMHVYAQDPTDCVASHLRPDLERTKAPT